MSARREAGIVYVVLLIYLTIMSCLGLAFIHKVGIEAQIVMNKGKGSQAHYLARSAASHAMWGMLNVPGFAPDGNIYYMHSFANGRYGYKVRKPTETTFATVATIGVLGENVVEQGYVPYILPSNVFTVYGSTTNSLPFYRRLIGADWGNPGTVTTGGSPTVCWAELEGCPVRKELVAGVIDSNSDIKLSVWNGSSWGNQHTFSVSADMNYKCFDIAYESQSGEALVMGRVGTGAALHYNIWNGTNWLFSNPQVAFSLPNGNVSFVGMASQPGSDEILIGVITELRTLQLVRWDGSAFHDLGTIEAQTARADTRVVEIIYEHQSGDAMVLWARNGDSAIKYRMWDGVALGAEGSLPDFGGVNNFWMGGTADSDPASDYIVFAALDNFCDINVAIWDGDNWIDSREIEISGAASTDQIFDVAWEAAGEDAVIAWAPWNATNVRSMTWKKGMALADCAIQEGPDLGYQGWLVRLLPISGTEKIVLLGENTQKDLRYCLWTGNKFKGDPAILLETEVPVQNEVAFDLAEANVPRSGGTGSAENQPPTVDAGPDQTIYIPDGQGTLDATVVDDGLPNPPQSVTTAWSQESGPDTVTFDDPAQIDTTATFPVIGTYVLRLTADDSEFNAFDEVTITVEPLPPYIETYQTWSPTIFYSWQVIDLSGEPFNVPPDAVLEIAVTNSNPIAEQWGGVRAVGSTLQRRFWLHEAESGGVDTVVMHVQSNSNSQIEYYANSADIEFTLVGYWTSGTYVETFDHFKAGGNASWLIHNLDTYGVSDNQVAEVGVINISTFKEYYAGVRTDGSSISRTLNISEAESGGVDTATMFVLAGSPNAAIELFANSNVDIDFYLIGYWSDPPGNYTETISTLGSPSLDQTWESVDLSSLGVPTNAVVQIAMANMHQFGENFMGLRKNGSLLERSINLHEAEGGGGDIATVHVETNSDAIIEWYHQDVSDLHNYYLIGYWETP